MTIAFDFDGVIHKYSKGWKDGSIYDPISYQWILLVRELLEEGHTVFILSTRSKRQIFKHFKKLYCFPDPTNKNNCSDYSWVCEFSFRVMPFWEKFVRNKIVDGIASVGICNHKAVFDVLIDDRVICFTGSYLGLKEKITTFKARLVHVTT